MMRTGPGRAFFAPALTLALLLCAPAARSSDLLLLHGHIYTGDPKAPWAQAVAITGSRIDAVGTDEEIVLRRLPNTRIIDLHGRTVIPGICDSHVHMWFGALALHGFNLSTPESTITPAKPELLIGTIRAYARSHPQEKILFGRADFSTAPPSTPTHELLDRAVADRPVIIHHVWEHALWLNAKALELAGITDEPVADETEERYVIRDASGHPSGVLLEAAMQLAERAVAARLSREEKLSLLREASRELNRYGITSVVNATGSLEDIELYAALRDRGLLTVRARTAIGAVAVNHRLSPAFLAALDKARTLYHDNWVSANLVKFFADGGTGLVPPLTYRPAEYRKLVLELDRRGYQIMTHAVRPDSVRMVLDTYEYVAKANSRRDRRFRTEHADTIVPEDLPRFAKLFVTASMQPAFCCSDIGSNYDPQEKNSSDRWQTLEQSRARLAFGSDWPCTWPPDPFAAIEEAVTRQIWRAPEPGLLFDGAGQGGAVRTGGVYAAEERISVEQAVAAYTRGSAYASFSEERVGTLEPGKEADLVVVSQDIFSIPPAEIGKTRVRMTMVGGKVVFSEAD